MVSTIVSALLPLALKLIGYFVEKQAKKGEAKIAWLKFLDSIESSLGDSARLRSSYQAQRDRIRAVLQESSRKKK